VWAADHGADVINLSLGSVSQELIGPGRSLRDALDHAWAAGAIPVIAGGNDTLPGSLLDVPAVVVAATDRDDQRAEYSSGVGNVRWGVAAPGGSSDDAASCQSEHPNGILSTWFRADRGAGGSTYACLSGTSMSAPFVSGALAVLRSAGFDPQEAVDRLLDTTDDLGPAGEDATFGRGRINLARALEGVDPTGQPVDSDGEGPPITVDPTAPTPTTPDPSPALTGTPTTGDGSATTATTVGVPSTAGQDGGAPPPTSGEAAPPVEAALPGGDDGSLPGLPLTTAVLLVVGTLGAHGWRLLRGSELFRRTPPDVA
jgi:hypothetical protein